jgi:hypothetical protein
MRDLADALGAEGHNEIADALERKELAGRLRHTGRTTWPTRSKQAARHARAGEEGTPPSGQPTPPAPHEQPARQLNAAQSRWITLGGLEGSDNGQAT